MTQTVTNDTLVVRIGDHSLSFSNNTNITDGGIDHEPIEIKGGISLATNLRETLKTARLTKEKYESTIVMVDNNSLVVPNNFLQAGDESVFYCHCFPNDNRKVMHNTLPLLNATVLFAVNNDLKTVINDKFDNTQYICAATPVWQYLYDYNNNETGNTLYGYFHEHKIDIISFAQNRFKFINTFPSKHREDALYYLMFVWKVLALRSECDKICLVGYTEYLHWLSQELQKHVRKTHILNCNEIQTEGIPYDILILFSKGY